LGKNASRADRMFKETGHQNAYFHYLFQSMFEAEENDLQKNAIVTHQIKKRSR
jgi:hypothetical protein